MLIIAYLNFNGEPKAFSYIIIPTNFLYIIFLFQDIWISAAFFFGTIIPSGVALRAVKLNELASISEVKGYAAYSAAAVCKM